MRGIQHGIEHGIQHRNQQGIDDGDHAGLFCVGIAGRAGPSGGAP